MSIIITDKTVGLWFVSSVTNDRDALLSLTSEQDRFKLTGRTRYYYKDDPGNDPHSDKDTKNWFSAISAPFSNTKENIEAVRGLAVEFKKEWGGGNIQEFLMDEKGVDDLSARFMASDFVHIKTETRTLQ